MPNNSYSEYKKLTIDLHNLFAKGLGQSAEANAVRESMEGPEKGLTEAEKDRLFNLSGDLFMLIDKEKKDGQQKDEGPEAEEFKKEYWKCVEEHNYDKALEILRSETSPGSKTSPLTRCMLAICRSYCYLALGDFDVALLFSKYADSIEGECEIRGIND
jgi:hypothetical protein